MTDRTWLPEADGKAVKIIAQLLPYLPPKPHRFRIIFMERNLDEVVASQARMLENRGKKGARLPEGKLKQAYAAQIAGLKRLLGQHQGVMTLWLDHTQVLADPNKIARRVALFLNRELDTAALAAVVDPGLYRQHTDSSTAVPEDSGD